MDKREVLASYAIRHHGDWNGIADALRKNENVLPVRINERFLTIYDQEYPKQLRRLRFPPWVVFYQGSLSLLEKPAITIIGSRKICTYASDVTEEAASVLSRNFVIVSGLAKGVDGHAHRITLNAGKDTIAVIGCGLDIAYPSCNRDLYERISQKGLILSEYPAGTAPMRWHFPWRNRILAALGQAVVVTQASLKSGTMLTVNEAINLGKEVWCVPYPYGNIEGMGCNYLIQQGANILYDKRALEEMRPLKELL